MQPLVHLLFMLAPTMLQCMPSLMEELKVRPRRAEGTHAAVDSCHMWRADGPLVAAPWGMKKVRWQNARVSETSDPRRCLSSPRFDFAF